ncbi:hypothetical protein CKO42_08625 [Lamprobacter modestohalophilus]|uniref:Uncharacterized protein n=1 Tax=Lamprobacter modestohalophilus TaxID=1064514 RepID=A0A9X0W7W4_9GAMM|nr:hypothetical protein [Lamprobacter modestohalophilus]MBK1618501.1 hypothetical protein [Lamprobacter modestohalophilus]
MAIINGRRIDPRSIGGGIPGRELVQHAKAGSGRRPILECNGKVEQIKASRMYSKRELVDRHGRGAKVASMPDRSKGHSFGGRRSAESKRIITEQVIDIAEHLFKQGVDFDEDDGHWMVVPKFLLPQRWHAITQRTPLMVAFPREYPALPPVGFYMMADIPISPDGHFFNSVYHSAWDEPLAQGWKWYCTYIHNGAWQPARNWRNGDNLYTYFHLVKEVLGN